MGEAQRWEGALFHWSWFETTRVQHVSEDWRRGEGDKTL